MNEYSTADYLDQLHDDKDDLVDNLIAKGVQASSSETFTTLVPKVLSIPTGSSSLSNLEDGTASGSVRNVNSTQESDTAGSEYALGNTATALGYNDKAEGDYALSAGDGSIASGDNSTAVSGGVASGDNSFAAGCYEDYQQNIVRATASTSGAAAFNGSSASGTNSFSANNGTASGPYSMAVGVATASGNYSFAQGTCTASGDNSVAIGNSNTASGYASFAMGQGSVASGSQAAALNNSTNKGSSSTAVGMATVYASAMGCFAEGNSSVGDDDTTVYGKAAQFAHSEGYANNVYGYYTHAEGTNNTIYGVANHVEGQYNTIGTVNSSPTANHVEGQYNSNYGFDSHIEGQYNEVSSGGNFMHIEGYHNIGASVYQHIEGCYNIAMNTGLPVLHIVGNGYSDNNRSNAHTLDMNGNAWFAGNVYVGSTSGTNKDAGSKRLASFSETVHYMDLDTDSANPIILNNLEPGIYINSNINKINEKCYTKGTTDQTTAAYINQSNKNLTVLYFKVLASFADAATNDDVAEFYGYERGGSFYTTGGTGGWDAYTIRVFKATASKTGSTTVNLGTYSSSPYFSVTTNRTASMPSATSQSEPDATHPTVIQYIGETDSNYTQGEFYKLVRPSGGTMADQYWQSLGLTSGGGGGGASWGSITGTLSNQTDLANALTLAPIPTVVDAHWTDAAREFIFADKSVGTYLVHNGSSGPQSDITSRTNMSFRASTATSSRVTVTAQWGIIYIIKSYNDASTDEVFGYALFANGQTDGTMEFKLQSITRLSSGYRVSFNNMMVTNNKSPIKKMIRLYDSSSTYNVDDLVLNTDGWFYRCTTAVTTPESFDYNKWTNFDGYGIDKYIKELIASVAPSSINLVAGTYSSSVDDQGIRMLANPGYASCVSSGLHTVALGTMSQATQREAMAVGYDARATGQQSFACGDTTRAKGAYSFAAGHGTIANNNQHASGHYNIEKASNTNMLNIIGNGTSDSARSNAYTLDSSGNAWFAGDVYVGSTSGTDKDAGSVKLAKESQLPSITSTTTDPGAGSTLAEGAIVLVYE